MQLIHKTRVGNTHKMQENKQQGSRVLLFLLIAAISSVIVIVIHQGIYEKTAPKTLINMSKLVACDFEVFGIVQGTNRTSVRYFRQIF